jgi:hypothetical protein
MSQREYLKALNSEIQKLNEIIDRKIMNDVDYRREARRHKALLTQLRKDESRRRFSSLLTSFLPMWR